jgi:hypothetical protein
VLAGALFLLAVPALPQGQAQQTPAQPEPAAKPRRVVVTFDGRLEDMPEVKPEDFQIEVGKQKLPPSRILKSDQMPTVLAIVLQDNQPPDFAAQLPTLRDFITSQPPNTYVGVFYLSAQTIDFALPAPHFDSDLPKVANALRAPRGSREAAPPSPYDKVAQIIAFMDRLSEARKEILLFSEGSDAVFPDSTPDQNRSLQKAAALSRQTGIPVWVVYSIAFPPERRLQPIETESAGRDVSGNPMRGASSTDVLDRSPLGSGATGYRSGLTYLDYLADHTGGKTFSPGGFAVAIGPYLKEFQQLLKQQVVLEYAGEGELRKVKMNRKLRGVKVLAPER